MPRHKDMISLKDACLGNIAMHMESYWWEIYGQCSRETWLRCKDKPFEVLPGSLMVNIIERLKEMNLLRNTHLLLLITTKLECLHLPRNCIPGKDVLILISQICKETLRELTVQQFYHRNELMDVLHSLEKLEVLDLSRSDVDEEILSAIGSSCPKIRDLDVSMSYEVTDDGIRYLFDDKLSANGYRGHGKCKLISRMNLRQTKVSQDGVFAAVENLPNLKHLDHPDVMKVLSIRQRDLPKRTALCNLSSVYGSYRELDDSLDTHADTLSLALDSCPYVTEVHLTLNGLQCLDPLRTLKSLKVLDLRMCAENDGLFPAMVLPVLKGCGNSLRTLSIHSFTDVNIGAVASHCRDLEVLIAKDNRSYSETSLGMFTSISTYDEYFGNLRVFKYRSSGDESDSNEEIGDVHLKAILSSPVLECIAIAKSRRVSDDLLKDVLIGGQEFSNLKELSVRYCHTLTAAFVRSILRLGGPLRRVDVLGCRNITKFDKTSLGEWICGNMWALQLSCIC